VIVSHVNKHQFASDAVNSVLVVVTLKNADPILGQILTNPAIGLDF